MTRDVRPVLLGMNNPLSSKPEHALYPHPPGCTGWRIWRMLCERLPVTQSQYLRAFDRRNLIDGKTWNPAAARRAAAAAAAALSGREVVVLGAQAAQALGLPPLLLHPQTVGGVVWRQLPHPSGRNRWYNSDDNRALASALLAELYSTVRVVDYN